MEEKDIMPEALDHSIRVLRNVPLISNRFLSSPSKLLAFLSPKYSRKRKVESYPTTS